MAAATTAAWVATAVLAVALKDNADQQKKARGDAAMKATEVEQRQAQREVELEERAVKETKQEDLAKQSAKQKQQLSARQGRRGTILTSSARPRPARTAASEIGGAPIGDAQASGKTLLGA